VRWLGDTSQLNIWFSMQAGLHEEAGRSVPAIAYYAATPASRMMAANLRTCSWSFKNELMVAGAPSAYRMAECFPFQARFTVSLNNDPQ
jgi:hypothetical protein